MAEEKTMMRRIKQLLVRYLCPDLYAESVSRIDLRQLRHKGYTTLFIDLDNTLLSWRDQEISNEVKAWIKEAQQLGYKMQIVSNTFHHRVNRFSDLLGIPGISTALKPRKRVFLEALRRVGSFPQETAIIGDQMFTDVFGGKRIGLFTILVPPVDRHELFTTGLVRIPEKLVLDYFKTRGLLPETYKSPSRG